MHLIADVEAKAKKVIRTHGWLKYGDHIAVLLSGDQKSSALLYFLKKLTAQRRDIRISAITTVDRTGSHTSSSRAKRIAECLDTELFEMSLPEESGIGTETGTGKNPDSASLPLLHAPRAILLDRIARQHGITKIAWGLCLDDAAGVVLESIIRGEGEKLVHGSSGQDAIIRICPFISVAATEVSHYAALCGWGDEPAGGLDPGEGLHKDTIDLLDRYTNNHPATRYALLNLGEELAGCLSGITDLIRAGEGYGEYERGCCTDGSGDSEVKNGTY
jgi:tRNA(Ile)-lysidine synthase TilS/MesJ